MSTSTTPDRPEQGQADEPPLCPECGGETFDFCGEPLCEACIQLQLVTYGDHL